MSSGRPRHTGDSLKRARQNSFFLIYIKPWGRHPTPINVFVYGGPQLPLPGRWGSPRTRLWEPCSFLRFEALGRSCFENVPVFELPGLASQNLRFDDVFETGSRRVTSNLKKEPTPKPKKVDEKYIGGRRPLPPGGGGPYVEGLISIKKKEYSLTFSI